MSELEKAAARLASTWDASGIHGDAAIFTAMTCTEVDALAEVLRAAGAPEVALNVIEAHATGDVRRTDTHYALYVWGERARMMENAPGHPVLAGRKMED